ncbi:Vitamin D-binding protein [Camelus dromedarius]|uniref:Vitamin D-binding protein n=1 Tax=Camelus dromedarius TaxID=9838 RepID=A0A5N4EGP9_CAMDR|nr:Vitamin D-binding protein [Camelus dromedarius]
MSILLSIEYSVLNPMPGAEYNFYYFWFLGRDYEKDKVCKELASLGKDDFTSLSMVLYSRKFPSGTFEQISHLVNEVVSLTEACCTEEADPDCYDNRTSALSAKSCESDSPFPVHPGTAECCTTEGLERKLCMAALKHQPQEFPTYVEPTNDEICEAFRKDPKGFANQFLYDYSINYGQAPLTILVSYTKSYLSMVGSCCTSPSPTVCFLRERLQLKHLSLLTTVSNRICSQYAAYGKEKSRLSHLIKFAQKVPTADLEDVLPLAEDLPEYTVKICDSLSTKNSKFKDCCQEKTPMDIFVCTYFMPAAPTPELRDVKLPTNKDVCDKENTKVLDQYAFELSRKTHIPEGPQLKKELSSFIAKGQELCADYSENTFTEYKKKLAERLRGKLPDATAMELKELVDKRSDFASKCCSINSPPLYCDSEIDAEMNTL